MTHHDKPPSQCIPSMNVTHADIYVAGVELDPAQVTSSLGIAGHWSHANGDTYIGRAWTGAATIETYTQGVWHLYSHRYITSRDPADHLRTLLALIYPLKTEWLRFVDSGFHTGIYVIHARQRDESGYTIDVDSLRQLAELRMCVSITCTIIESHEEDAS
ncbi:MAG: DUF4279 domain-containing protein [Phycisphaerae bacterium]|nr:DUF4279 domain-containing protein [Phycisphaerae bacterium]